MRLVDANPGDELDPAAITELVLAALVHDLRSPIRAVSNFAVSGEGPEVLERISAAAAMAHTQLDGVVDYLELIRATVGAIEAVPVADTLRAVVDGGVEVAVDGPPSVMAPSALRVALSVVVADAVATGSARDGLSAVVTVDGSRWAVRLTAPGRGVLGPGQPRGLAPFRWSDGTRTDGPLGPLTAWSVARRWHGDLTVAAEADVATIWHLHG